MRKLAPEERLRLLRFVCSFAWTDLEVTDSERRLIERMALREGLSEEERRQVQNWIKTPPPPESVDPTEIPMEHRRHVLDMVRELILVDGNLSPSEKDSLAVFEELLREDHPPV